MPMKKILIFLICLLTTTSSFAINDIQKVSLEEAIDIALKTNPQIKMLGIDTDIALNEIKVADKLKNPSAHYFQNIGKAGEGNPQQMGISYEIDVLKRSKRKNLARSNSQIAFDIEEYSRHCLIFEVKKAYIDLLLKKTKLKIVNSRKELAKELFEYTTKEADNKKIPKTEAIQAKIALNKAIMDYNNAQSEFIFSQNRFNTVMNANKIDYDTKEETLSDNYSELLAVDPKYDFFTLDSIINFALENRKDLLAVKGEVESAQSNLKLVKSNLIPDLEFSGGYAYQTGSTSANGNFLSGGYVGASVVNIPLIYHYKPEIQNAKLAIERTQLKYEDAKIDVKRNVTDAWEKYTIAKNTINFYNKEILSDTKELWGASIESHEKKEIDVTSFIVSKKLYFELMLEYEEALAQYYISFAELLKEMNALIADLEKL